MDGGWGWVIAFSGMFVTSLYAGAQRCFSVFYGVLMYEFNVSYGQISWLNGVFLIGYGLGSLLIPLIYKKISYRTGVMAAGLISCISVFTASQLNGLSAIVCLLGLMPGFCTAANTVGLFSTVSRRFDERRNTAMQILCSGVSLGAFVYCPFYQVLIDTYSWKGALLIMSGLYLNIMVVGALLRPIVVSPSKCQFASQIAEVKIDLQINNNNMVQATTTRPSTVGQTIRRQSIAIYRESNVKMLINLKFQIYSWAWVFYSAAFYSALTYLVPFGKTELHFSDVEAATLVSAVAFGEIGSRAFFALLFDKFDKAYRMKIVIVINFILAILFCCLPFIHHYVALLVICAVVGLCGGGLDAVYAVFIVDLFGLQHFDTVCGYSSVVGFLMGSVTTVLMGVAIDVIGNIHSVFFIGSGTLIISSVLMFLLIRLSNREPPQ